MTGLTQLWLPILVSSVIVFVLSSVIHMVLPWHKNDYPKLANEDKVLDALRPLGLPPGDYLMPRPSSTADMKSPEFVEKLKKGPAVVMTVLPSGGVSMGRSLVLWFLYSVVVGIFSGYVASRALGGVDMATLDSGARYLHVFRFVGVTAFTSYALALWQLSIWYNRSWGITIKATIDGLIYALFTAGTFGWLWPH